MEFYGWVANNRDLAEVCSWGLLQGSPASSSLQIAGCTKTIFSPCAYHEGIDILMRIASRVQRATSRA